LSLSHADNYRRLRDNLVARRKSVAILDSFIGPKR
jgi:hypothetical protein